MKSSRLETTTSYLILTAMGVVTVVPFVAIVLTALHPSGSPVSGLSLPDQWSWGNFSAAWTSAGFGRLMLSSLLVCVGVVPVALVLATIAGYGLALVKPPGGNAAFTLFLLGLTLPSELIIVPLYFDLQQVGLSDSYLGVILAEMGLFLPFGVFWMRQHFLTMPRSLLEAASIDGATEWRTLRSVLLPLARPAMSTLAVLYFMWAWNQFLLVLVLIQNPENRTAVAGLGYFVGEHTTNVPLLAAGTIMVIVPVGVVYLVFQRQFIRGMLQGAVKA
nr:carbohydrate ABC transporter permease [Streptomyces sp. NBC_00886]